MEKKIDKKDQFESINPANTSQTIAKVSKATKEDVEKAFQSANEIPDMEKMVS